MKNVVNMEALLADKWQQKLTKAEQEARQAELNLAYIATLYSGQLSFDLKDKA